MNTQPLLSSTHRYAGLANLFEPDNIAIIHAVNQFSRNAVINDPAAYGLTAGNCSFVLSAIDCVLVDLSTLLEALGRTSAYYPANDFIASDDLPLLVNCFSTLSTLSGCVIPELIELQQRVEWVQLHLKDKE